MPFIQEPHFHSAKYDQQLHALYSLETMKLLHSPHYTIDQKEFQKKADNLLLGFCEKTGLIAFGNNDYQNPVLQKLVYSFEG